MSSTLFEELSRVKTYEYTEEDVAQEYAALALRAHARGSAGWDGIDVERPDTALSIGRTAHTATAIEPHEEEVFGAAGCVGIKKFG